MRIQLAELTEKANAGDEYASIARSSSMIQIAYLQLAFHRLKSLSAIDKLPPLDDASADGPREFLVLALRRVL